MKVILIYSIVSIVRVPTLRGSISSELMSIVVTVASMLDAKIRLKCAALRSSESFSGDSLLYCLPAICFVYSFVLQCDLIFRDRASSI